MVVNVNSLNIYPGKTFEFRSNILIIPKYFHKLIRTTLCRRVVQTFIRKTVSCLVRQQIYGDSKTYSIINFYTEP